WTVAARPATLRGYGHPRPAARRPAATRRARRRPARRGLLPEPRTRLGPPAPCLAAPLPAGLRRADARQAPGALRKLPPRHHRPARPEIHAQRLWLLVPPRGRRLPLAKPPGPGPRRAGRGCPVHPAVPGRQRGAARPGLAGTRGLLVGAAGRRPAVG